MVIGILALQGCIEPHEAMLRRLDVASKRVRSAQDLTEVSHLILPGGESTTMLRLIESAQLLEPLRAFGATKPMWGVCAGAILLAKEVCHPSQSSLALMDIRATRNFYGSQRESFKSQVTVLPFQDPFEVDFIRAPLLEATNPQVEILASHDGRAAMLKQGKLLVSSFHVELGQDPRLHDMFLRGALGISTA